MPTSARTLLPTETDAQVARESSKALATLIEQDSVSPLRFHAEGESVEVFALTLPTARLLLDALQKIGDGDGVTLTSSPKELTTQQAADFLLVSRPYLINELLEKGKISFRKVGNRRRIRYDALVRYQEEEEREIARREKVLLELMAETELLGLYE